VRANQPDQFECILERIKLLARADAADHGGAEPWPIQVGQHPHRVLGDEPSDLNQTLGPGAMLALAHQIVQQPVGQWTGERLRAEPLHDTKQPIRDGPEHCLDDCRRLADDQRPTDLGKGIERGETFGRRDLPEAGGQRLGSARLKVC
jgi:hypothetical protein